MGALWPEEEARGLLAAHAKTLKTLRRLVPDFDRSDPRQWWAFVAPLHQLGHRLRIPFDDHLHAPVREVAGPTGHANIPGLVHTTAAEPHALDPPADPKVLAYHQVAR